VSRVSRRISLKDLDNLYTISDAIKPDPPKIVSILPCII